MRKLVFCLALAAALLGAAGPAAADAATHSPVHLRTLSVSAGLEVARPASAERLGASATGLPATAWQRSAAAAAGDVVTLDAGGRFTMLGVLCDVPQAGGEVRVRLRVSRDGRVWGAWLEAPLELAGETGGAPHAYTEPVWTGPARYAQVAAAGSGAAPATLRHVRLVTLLTAAAADDAGVAGPASAAGRTAATSAAATRASAARPAIVSRSGWGADESLRGSAPDYATVKLVVVHNTAGGNDYTAEQAPAVVRGIYAYHTQALGWNDIAYNFLVDRFGTVYEGRAGGVRRGVIGAHTLGFNTGSCGVSLMGNFMAAAPPPAALAALERLLAWKLSIHKLKPLGSTVVRCLTSGKFAAGTRVKLPVIAGHLQVNDTDCPGAVLYPLLSTIRLEAAGKPQPPVIALATASADRFSPNGDGVLDAVRLQIALTKAAAWSVVIRDARGRQVAQSSGEAASAQVTWRGATAGRACADGAYTATIAATSSLGAAAPRKLRLVVDTRPPALTSFTAAPRRFSPNGDGWDDSTALRYQPAETCATRVAIVDAQRKVRRRLSDWHSTAAARTVVRWDGVFASGDAAAETSYHFQVEARDRAGNTAVQTAPVFVDRTLGFALATPSWFSPNHDGVGDLTSLGFRLTRPATVKVRVKIDGKTVRTLSPGRLAAGVHAVTWDGLTSTGALAASTRLLLTVNATSALGTILASSTFVADLDAPTLSAPVALTGTAGKALRLSCTPKDATSTTVALSYAVVDAAGLPVAGALLGDVPAGKPATWTWTPPASGVYTVTYTGTDLAGNGAALPAVTVVTVR